MSDAAKVGAGAAKGGLGGAASGAATGAAITAAGGPLTAGAGALIGGLIGLLGGGLGAYAETQEDDIPGKESKKCPAGYVYNPATRACQPEGDTAKKVAALRSVKNKEGKSMFDETVRKLVTKPKDPAGGGGGGGGAADPALTKMLWPDAPAAAPASGGGESLQGWAGGQSFGAPKESAWGDQVSERVKWLLEQKAADPEDDEWPDTP